jgi:hypothetical protein
LFDIVARNLDKFLFGLMEVIISCEANKSPNTNSFNFNFFKKKLLKMVKLDV